MGTFIFIIILILQYLCAGWVINFLIAMLDEEFRDVFARNPGMSVAGIVFWPIIVIVEIGIVISRVRIDGALREKLISWLPANVIKDD